MVNSKPAQLPADHPLAGCDAKLRRAEQNLKLLDDELGSYLDRHVEPIPSVGKFDPETNLMEWRFRAVEPIDPILSAVIGDYIHDLRSTLDHLAFELSFLDTGGIEPPRTIAFPCCRTRKPQPGVKGLAWDSKKVKQERLVGINRRHRAMIYQAQPCYRRQDAPTNAATLAKRPRHALADLEDFWNDDKHRTLQPVASAPFHLYGEISGLPRDCVPRGILHLEPGVFGLPLQENARTFWLPVRKTGPNPEVEMKFQVAVRITFRNGLPALDVLAALGNWVSVVVERFLPEFETPAARRLWGLPRGGWIETVPIGLRTRFFRTEPEP